MCYMIGVDSSRRRRRKALRTVGVRELRQNLSVYLDRVKAGEAMNVTEHGHVVAILAPLPVNRLTTLQRLVGEGRATAPTRSLRALGTPEAGAPGAPASEDVIAELREERL